MTDTTSTSPSSYSWKAFKSGVLGPDHVTVALSSLPDPVNFNPQSNRALIKQHVKKCQTLLHNELKKTSGNIDPRKVNRVQFTTLSGDRHVYDHSKYCKYIEHLDMVVNMTKEDRATPLKSIKKILDHYNTIIK